MCIYFTQRPSVKIHLAIWTPPSPKCTQKDTVIKGLAEQDRLSFLKGALPTKNLQKSSLLLGAGWCNLIQQWRSRIYFLHVQTSRHISYPHHISILLPSVSDKLFWYVTKLSRNPFEHPQVKQEPLWAPQPEGIFLSIRCTWALCSGAHKLWCDDSTPEVKGLKHLQPWGLPQHPRNTRSGLELTPCPDSSPCLLSLVENPPGVGGRRMPSREYMAAGTGWTPAQPTAWGRLVSETAAKWEKRPDRVNS